MLLKDSIMGVDSNILLEARRDGKLVPGLCREGHNVFTVTGRNWLSKLSAWYAIGTDDQPYTRRRVRWIGVGSGSQFEVTTVSALANQVLVNASNYLVTLDSVEFPTSTSVRFIKEFGTAEISYLSTTVLVSEAGLFVDCNPAVLTGGGAPYTGYEDGAAPGETTTLDPNLSGNPPVAYKSFEALPKTPDFTLLVKWEFRF